MSGATIATLAAMLTLDVSDFSKGANKAAEDTKSLGDRLTGFAPIAAAGFAVAGAAIVGVGAALYSVGNEFDAAYDTIRTGTGKTGDALDELKGSFENVVSTVPATFEDASNAITMLNQRLGLTGEPLEMLSEQFLDLSRITGEDLTTSIQTMTRVFGDWSIKDQVGAMDEMFRASQATGTGMAKLSEQVVQFGAPLRGLGFGFEESIAMLGKWEKEGVNVENVMGAMKKAYGQFSKEFGSKAPEEFRKFVEQLSKAPDSASAAALAIEKLGVRNGPDFAAAVKEGRFAYADLVDVIKNGSDTIGQAGADTEDFAEKWQRFLNRMKVIVQPIATEVFGAVGSAMDAVGPQIEQVAQWFAEKLPLAMAALQAKWEEFKPLFIDGANQLKDRAKELGEALKTALEWLTKPENDAALKAVAITIGTLVAGAFVALGAAAWSAAAGVIAATWPFVLIAVVVGGLAFAVMKLYENWDTFRNIVQTVGGWLQANLPGILATVTAAIVTFYTVALAPLIGYIQQNSEAFANIGKALLVVGAIIAGVVIVSFVAMAAVFVTTIAAAALVAAAIGAVIVVFYNLIQVVWDVGQNIGVAIAAAVRAVWNLYLGVQDMVNGVNAKLSEVAARFFGLQGQILSAVGNLGGLLWNSGASLLSGLWDGISSKVGWLKDKVSGLVGSIRNFFPFSPAKEGPMSGRGHVYYSGQALAEDFAEGMMSRQSAVVAGAVSLLSAVKQQFGLADAAREALAHLQAGGDFYEDFSYSGISANGSKWNDALADLFYTQGPGQFGDWFGANATVRGSAWDSGVYQFLNDVQQQQPTVTFAGDTDGAFASAFMKMVRTGQIQIQAA